MKTSELQGAALDWAVGVAAYGKERISVEVYCPAGFLTLFTRKNDYFSATIDRRFKYEPSKKWGHGGPVIERERIELHNAANNEWAAHAEFQVYGLGPTPLIAAMRCFVSSRLGDEVEIPEELK